MLLSKLQTEICIGTCIIAFSCILIMLGQDRCNSKAAERLNPKINAEDQVISAAKAQADIYRQRAEAAQKIADMAAARAVAEAKKRQDAEARLKAYEDTPVNQGGPTPDIMNSTEVKLLKDNISYLNIELQAKTVENSNLRESIQNKDFQIHALQTSFDASEKARALEKIQHEAQLAAVNARGWKRTIEGVGIGFGSGFVTGMLIKH